MNIPRISVDFQNCDPWGRVRLTTVGTAQDLSRLGVILRPGLALFLYCDELEAEGEVLYSEEEHIWVAKIDLNAIRTRGSSKEI